MCHLVYYCVVISFAVFECLGVMRLNDRNTNNVNEL